MLDHRAQGQNDNTDGSHRAKRGGGDVLRQTDAVIVQQDHRNPDPCGKALVVGQGGDKHPQGDQRRAHNEKRQHGAIRGQQVHIPELAENQRIYRHNAQRDHVDHQQSQILAHDDLGGGDGQGVQQLVGLLLPLLGDDPHGQDICWRKCHDPFTAP